MVRRSLTGRSVVPALLLAPGGGPRNVAAEVRFPVMSSDVDDRAATASAADARRSSSPSELAEMPTIG